MSEVYSGRTLSARYPVDRPAWQTLKSHYREELRNRSLRELFRRDRSRAGRLVIAAGDLTLDFSKNHVTDKTLKLFAQLAEECLVPSAIESMFAGERINVTEDRAVLHVALRSKLSDRVALDVPGVGDVWQVLTRIEAYVDAVHAGRIAGHTGKRLRNVVNIGIGGSDLGPVMAARALRAYWVGGMRFFSVSNVDGTQLADLCRELDPAETLLVICSKTFTTLETMSNAEAARTWIVNTLGEAAVAAHFAAASTNHDAMDDFGIHPKCRFGFWNWVGGRYSLWSAVGLSLALVTGFSTFLRMLAGGRVMDGHFRQAPMDRNMPVTLAMLGNWYNNFFGAETHAILPYDHRLDRFPAYLQQLQMESNGKSRRTDGRPVRCETGAVIWGEAGNNAQHAFYQLLHQGTRLVPVDFLLPVKSSGAAQAHQDLAVANCLAQAEALMDGCDTPGLAPHRVHAGNHPSSLLLFEALTPETLGQLIALYEHKVFVEGVIWGIDSFDQWGVELGKRLSSSLTDAVTGTRRYSGTNASTAALLDQVRQFRP